MTRLRACLLVVIFGLVLAGCKVDLHSKLSESEANEMVALLIKNGISATRVYAKDGTSVVKVEEASFAQAVSVLSAAGLPRTKFATMGEVFADNKLISSPTEERARFIYALSQELSRTLSEIDGVIAARIHVVLPKNDPLKLDEKPSSASVFVKHDPSIPVTQLLPQIKTLVTNSIEGLVYEKVSVVFVPSEKALRRTAELSETTHLSSGFFIPGIGETSPISLLIAVFGWATAMMFGFLWWRSKDKIPDPLLLQDANAKKKIETELKA